MAHTKTQSEAQVGLLEEYNMEESHESSSSSSSRPEHTLIPILGAEDPFLGKSIRPRAAGGVLHLPKAFALAALAVLATLVPSFCRRTPHEPELMKARMALYDAARVVLNNGMRLLGLSPVERM